jgi:tagaturonate reductase
MILKGMETVEDIMNDKEGYEMVSSILFKETGKVLNIPESEVFSFAHEVINRFRNPFINHELHQIAFQSTLKWKNRVLPLLLTYVDKFGSLPEMTTRGFAGLIRYNFALFPNDKLNGSCTNKRYAIADEQWPLYQDFWNRYAKDYSFEALTHLLSNTTLWGEDLTLIPGFADSVHQELLALSE